MPQILLKPFKLFSVIAATLFSLVSVTVLGAEHEDSDIGVNVKLGYDRAVGKYGQTMNSTASTSSVTTTYDAENYSFDLLIPYLEQSGPGRRISISGQRPIVLFGPDQRASGLGDVTAGLTRYVLNEEDHSIDLDLGAIFKFHTASADKGLGSGKSDLAIQSTLSRSFGDFNSSVTIGYTFVGKPPDQNYRNAYYTSLDGSYKLFKSVSAGLTYSAGGSIINNLPGTRDVTAYINFKPSKKFKLDFYYLVGRTNQSPDHSAGITIAYDF